MLLAFVYDGILTKNYKKQSKKLYVSNLLSRCMTTLEQASQLINLAKQAVGSELSGKTLVIDKAIEKQFSNYLGVFITLKKHGELRGCIGFPLPHYRLYRAVIEAAKAAAFSDPRFSPVVEDELDQISFEISILSVPKKIDINEDNYDKLIKIEIGRAHV